MRGPLHGAALVATVAATVVAGCGDESASPEATRAVAEPEATTTVASPTTTDAEAVAPEPLPAPVARTRAAIISAAHALDYDRLAGLATDDRFTYSFGESGDPAGYWRGLEEEGHVPIIGDFLPVLLNMPHARRGGIYVWPSAFAKHPSAWTAAERRQLLYVHGADEIRAFERQGAYTGYRVGIRGDGAWLFFVAGD